MTIYEVLNNLDIKYTEIEHEPVYTCEQANKCYRGIEGQGCKSLFLIDKKKNYYMAIIPDTKRANLKELSKLVNGHLSFASDERLKEVLDLIPGSVTPLGVMNDNQHQVKLLLDKELVGIQLLFHPLVNTKTVSISYDDLVRFIEHFGNDYQIVEM
ncbi:MAG: prolyl-tRNA synthetase associated domain-containing protein [Candidatus Saccharibacteria bacterium]|nr:prolyl-tRNA synthetase associated domain-containing protein [Candidatus Saccharibacteria bacterium]